MPLDTIATVETPEGVELRLAPAGLVPRALAYSIDVCVYSAALAALSGVLAFLGAMGIGMSMIIAFFTLWFYPVAFEVLGQGQTPGKRMIGLRVVHDDGTPIRLPASVVRNLLVVVDLLPGSGLAAVICMLISPQFRRIGDLVAGTMVIYTDARRVRGLAGADVEPLPLPRALRLDEQQLLVAFAERSEQLSSARAEELAGVLEPLVGLQGGAAVRQLVRYAKGIVGSHPLEPQPAVAGMPASPVQSS